MKGDIEDGGRRVAVEVQPPLCLLLTPKQGQQRDPQRILEKGDILCTSLVHGQYQHTQGAPLILLFDKLLNCLFLNQERGHKPRSNLNLNREEQSCQLLIQEIDNLLSYQLQNLHLDSPKRHQNPARDFAQPLKWKIYPPNESLVPDLLQIFQLLL